MATGYTNSAGRHDGKSDHPVRWRAGWIGLKHSADLLMGPRSARCSVFKDRCASCGGIRRSQTPGPRKEAPEDQEI
jgi:hypothetical protein